MKTKCEECNGSGSVYSDPFRSSMDPSNELIDCPDCEGAGEFESDDEEAPTIEELLERAANAFKMARAAKLHAWAIEARALRS